MDDNVLVVYYSWSGNTRRIAELIAQETGADLFEAEPVEPYTTNYSACVAQARNEIKTNYRPVLIGMPESKPYSTIFLGTPIWCATMAPPLATFIDNFAFNGLTVLPFYTHGGGGGGRFERDIASMCRGANILSAYEVYGRGGSESPAQIQSWIKSEQI